MGSAIFEALPPAVGVVLVNPVPIMAVILMLLAPRGRATASMFAAGWMIGLLLVMGLLLFVAPPEPIVGDDRSPSTLASLVEFLLGFVLILLAVRQWWRRSKPAEAPAAPAWMEKLGGTTPAAALGLGAVMSGVNPKNLALNVVAVVAIAQAHLPIDQKLLPVAIYVLLASAGVLAPVIWYFAAADTATKTLRPAKAWLAANYPVIMAIMLALFGLVLSSRGLAELIG